MQDLTAEILSQINGEMTARVLKGGVELRIFMPFAEKPKKVVHKTVMAMDESAVELAETLMYRAKRYLPPMTKEKSDQAIRRWAIDIQKIHRIDKIDYGHIGTIMTWMLKDPFWHNKVLSGAKFRKQFPTLWAQAKADYEKNRVEEV